MLGPGNIWLIQLLMYSKSERPQESKSLAWGSIAVHCTWAGISVIHEQATVLAKLSSLELQILAKSLNFEPGHLVVCVYRCVCPRIWRCTVNLLIMHILSCIAIDLCHGTAAKDWPNTKIKHTTGKNKSSLVSAPIFRVTDQSTVKCHHFENCHFYEVLYGEWASLACSSYLPYKTL